MMLIKQIYGEELEKAKPNTSEDFFNRSTVVYIDKGEEKVFHLLYIRYFDELVNTFTPYENEPLFTVKDREITFKDIVALVCLLVNPGFIDKKRVYVNEAKQFERYFRDINFTELAKVIEQIEHTGEYKWETSAHILNSSEQTI